MSTSQHPPERVLLFAFTWFLYNFSYWMIMSFLPVHLGELGLSRTEVGYWIAFPQFVTLLAALPFGYMSDWLPARRLSLVGLGCIMVWAAGLSWLGKGPLLLAAFMLLGLGMPLHLVSFNALYLKHLSGANQGRKVGAFVFAQFLGYALGPVALPLVQRLPHTGSTVVPGFAVATLGFAAAFALTSLLRDPERFPFHLSEYSGDIRSRRGFLVTLLILLYSLHFGAEQAFFPNLLREQCAMSQLKVGLVFAYSGALVGVAGYMAGHAFDTRRRLFSVMAACMVLSGAFQAATGLCTGFYQVLGVRTLHTVADGALNCYITLFVAVAFPRHRVGGNFGFVFMIRTLAILLGSAASGHLVQRSGLAMPFYATGIACAATGLTFWALRPTLKRVMGEAA